MTYMKRTTTYFFPAILALMAATGCSNDNEPGPAGRSESPAFTASIGVESRAYNDSWEIGDEIGISGAKRNNVRHITNDGDGIFTVKTPGEQIYFQDENDATFTAYYPWNGLAAGSSKIRANTASQSEPEQKKFDFLWAQASGKKDSPNVKFAFSHRMVKLLLTVKPGDGMSFDEVKSASISLGGFRHGGSFDTSDGTATADSGKAVDKWTFSGGVVAPVEINETAKTATFSLILFPQAFSSSLTLLAELDLENNADYRLRAYIDFTSANSGKDNEKAKNEWVAGRQYNLSLTLNKTEISINKCEISPWLVVEGDEITVD